RTTLLAAGAVRSAFLSVAAICTTTHIAPAGAATARSTAAPDWVRTAIGGAGTLPSAGRAATAGGTIARRHAARKAHGLAGRGTGGIAGHDRRGARAAVALGFVV